jgi:hypothetical protein
MIIVLFMVIVIMVVDRAVYTTYSFDAKQKEEGDETEENEAVYLKGVELIENPIKSHGESLD